MACHHAKEALKAEPELRMDDHPLSRTKNRPGNTAVRASVVSWTDEMANIDTSTLLRYWVSARATSGTTMQWGS